MSVRNLRKLFKQVCSKMCISGDCMASVENQILFIAYVTLAGVLAMIYGLRRIFLLEKKIVSLEKAIVGKKRR